MAIIIYVSYNKLSMNYYSAILNQMIVKIQGELFEIKILR